MLKTDLYSAIKSEDSEALSEFRFRFNSDSEAHIHSMYVCFAY